MYYKLIKLRILHNMHLCNYARSLVLKYEKNPHGVYVYISGLRKFMIALDSHWYQQLGQ